MLGTMITLGRCLRPGLACAAALAAVLSLYQPGFAGQDRSGQHPVTPLTRTWTITDDTAGPYPRWEHGAGLRVRLVHMENATDLGTGGDPDPTRRFLRLKSQAWLRRRFSPTTSVYARINNESRAYFECESCDSHFDEIIVENLYIETTRLFGLPVGLRLGRHDLFYGDGFVICDGTPLDGSRTSYVNGALLTFTFREWAFDAFVTWNRRREQYLPRLNNQYTPLLEFNSLVAGLYFKRLLPPDHASGYLLEHYYIFEEDRAPGKIASFHTLGTRLGFPLYFLRLSGDLAYQAGRAPEYKFLLVERGILGPQTVTAYGIQLTASTGISRPVPVDLAGGYIHLSGDDPVSQKEHEGWNPILGRWPQWSELYIYTLLAESFLQPMDQGVAYWQNLKAPFVRIEVRPRPEIRFQASHMWMGQSQAAATLPVDAEPSHRGDLLALRLSWKAADRLFGHLLYERFEPGDAYVASAGSAIFMRLEVSMSL
jgi:hypothetical protein